MPRGFFNMAENVLTYNKEAIMVNLYTQSKTTVHPMEGEAVTIEISDGYLERCEVTLKVNALLKARNMRFLKLRIPSWSKYTVIIADGKTLTLNESNIYYALPLSNGESEITIKFDNTPRLIEGKYAWDHFVLTPYMLQRYKSGDTTPLNMDTLIDKDHATLFVGPVLLARTKVIGNTKEEMFDSDTICGKGYSVKAIPIKKDGVACAYEVTFTNKNEEHKSFTTVMCDFASAADTEEYMEYRYTVFI